MPHISRTPKAAVAPTSSMSIAPALLVLARVEPLAAAVRAGSDMDEIAGLDGFEPMANTTRDDVSVAPLATPPSSRHRRSGLHRRQGSTPSRHSRIQELVTVRVDLPTMRARPVNILNSSNCVSIDSLRRPGRADLIVIDQSRARSATFPLEPVQAPRRRRRGGGIDRRDPRLAPGSTRDPPGHISRLDLESS